MTTRVATSGHPTAPRPWLITLGLLSLILFVFPLSISFPLLDPAEGLHASIAQEMVERGDWITPRLFGAAFLDKPILFFWAQAASLSALGMHEQAVRLPGLLFGLLGVLTTGLVGGRLLGRPTGLLAAMFHATLVLPTAMAQAAAHDVTLIPWINLALLSYWEAERASTRRRAAAWTVAVGIALGLACLTKGLVGVAVVGVVYGSYLLTTRRLTLKICLRGAVTLLLAAVVALPWYLAMEVRNPGYLHYYFVERHVMGFATDTQIHAGQPWWYYFPLLLAGGLPWIAYLSVVARDGWARWKQAQRSRTGGALAFVWCWLIGSVLLLTLAKSKTVAYLLPAFPPVAILGAFGWVQLIQGELTEPARKALVRTFMLSTPLAPLPLLVALLVVQERFGIRFGVAVWTLAVLVAATAWLPWVCWRAGRPTWLLSAGTLSVAAQFVVLMALVVPPVATAYSARELAREFNRRGRIPPKVYFGEERIGSLAFYLAPRLRAKIRPDQFAKIDFAQLAKLPPTSPGAVVTIATRRLDRASRFFDLDELAYTEAGRHRLYRLDQLRAAPNAPGRRSR